MSVCCKILCQLFTFIFTKMLLYGFDISVYRSPREIIGLNDKIYDQYSKRIVGEGYDWQSALFKV